MKWRKRVGESKWEMEQKEKQAHSYGTGQVNILNRIEYIVQQMCSHQNWVTVQLSQIFHRG